MLLCHQAPLLLQLAFESLEMLRCLRVDVDDVVCIAGRLKRWLCSLGRRRWHGCRCHRKSLETVRCLHVDVESVSWLKTALRWSGSVVHTAGRLERWPCSLGRKRRRSRRRRRQACPATTCVLLHHQTCKYRIVRLHAFHHAHRQCTRDLLL